MRKVITGALLSIAVIALLGADECGPSPTKSVFSEQRKVPFFKVLVYEQAQALAHNVTFVLFEGRSGQLLHYLGHRRRHHRIANKERLREGEGAETGVDEFQQTDGDADRCV